MVTACRDAVTRSRRTQSVIGFSVDVLIAGGGIR
jgi:hypothetical protein